MDQRVDAIFENGVFRPEAPVNIPDGERVLLRVESREPVPDGLSDVADLLDVEYTEACRRRRGSAPSLEEVRRILSKFTGSLADRVSEERNER